MKFAEEEHEGSHQNGGKTEVIIDVVNGGDGIVGQQKNHKDQDGVDGPGAPLAIAEGKGFADEIGTDLLGDTAQ